MREYIYIKDYMSNLLCSIFGHKEERKFRKMFGNKYYKATCSRCGKVLTEKWVFLMRV